MKKRQPGEQNGKGETGPRRETKRAAVIRQLSDTFVIKVLKPNGDVAVLTENHQG